MKFFVSIATSSCVGCSECVDTCPKNIFVMNKDIAIAENMNKCIGCRICEKTCPTNSILIKT